MPNIFNYLNYREFLQDFYNEEKQRFPAFSYQYFAEKAGFSSKSFFRAVILGTRNLAEESMAKMQRVLKLNEKAYSYFCTLVAFNQAKSIEQQNLHFAQLMQYNRRNVARLVVAQHYELYSKWYHNTVRELVTMVDFREDYALLGRMVKPAIPARAARASVQLLLRLGLIEKRDGRYLQTDRMITTGDEVQSLAVANFHVQNLMIAAESIDTTPAQDRDISCIVAGLSPKGFVKVKDEIQQFRRKLLEIVDKEKDTNRVYNINFQFVPTSQPVRQP